MACSEIPYFSRTGNFYERTGNLYRKSREYEPDIVHRAISGRFVIRVASGFILPERRGLRVFPEKTAAKSGLTT
jgi:hypothetical protein